MYSLFAAWRINLCSKSYSAVAHFFGSLTKQQLTKWTKFLEYLVWSSVGGSFFKMLTRTFIAGRCRFGGSPKANSIATIPRDHISAEKSYPFLSLSTTSGAIQQGLPHKVVLLYPF